jgi:alkylation response protein AidB-like acyl-CoA dehydrogenase
MNKIFNSSLVDTADHHPLLRESVGKLVGSFGRRYFQDVVRQKAKPVELWEAMAKAGYLGVHISEQYGGGAGNGSGLADYNVVVEESAAQGCPMLSLVIGSICAPIIEQHGSEALKNLWLPGLADGSMRLAFAITEPNAGTNTHKVSTLAKRDGTGWKLSGTKYWTSAVDESDSIMVVARGEELDEAGRAHLSLFIVKANALGEEGQGLRHLFAGLNPERVCAAAINNGIARFAIEKGAQYAIDRTVWKTPIGAHQGIAHPLAKAYVAVQQARLMTARAAQLFDAGSHDAGEAANMAKFAAADASLEALDQAIQTHGGNGMALEYGLADLWFIARLHKTAPVSREMILNFIAQHSLGLPKSY